MYRPFLNVYSFVYSLIISFLLCVFPFGVRLSYKALSYTETLLPYVILMTCSIFFNMFRAWYYQANPLCIFFVINSEFHRCIQDEYFNSI